jgi:hypothetical protein
VDDEDGRVAWCDTGDAEEENVILSDGHDGIIVGGIDLRRSVILPGDGTGTGGDEIFHVEGPQLALGECILKIGRLVTDNVELLLVMFWLVAGLVFSGPNQKLESLLALV